MKTIEFAPAASTEFKAAVDQYELERPGRGKRFAAAVERAMTMISRFPRPPQPIEQRGPSMASVVASCAVFHSYSRIA